MNIGPDDAGQVFAALADPTRRHLVRHLAESGDATATELAGDLPISRQAVSKHLALLEDVGLVAPERSGREVRYRLSTPPLDAAVAWMADVGARWDDRLAALDRAVRGRDRTRSR